jgi:hypothetical protein
MVSVRFAATGLASGNQARPLFALGMDDHEYPAQCIRAQSDKALFTSGVRIFDGESHRITKCLLGVSKADTMLPQVRLGLGWSNSTDMRHYAYSMHTCKSLTDTTSVFSRWLRFTLVQVAPCRVGSLIDAAKRSTPAFDKDSRCCGERSA